ncbi:MAG: hypothetical protein AB8G11_09640 [Saprospiraceae bacterium]
MDDLTSALLKDLQDDLNIIKKLKSNKDVVFALNRMKKNINFTQELIKK